MQHAAALFQCLLVGLKGKAVVEPVQPIGTSRRDIGADAGDCLLDVEDRSQVSMESGFEHPFALGLRSWRFVERAHGSVRFYFDCAAGFGASGGALRSKPS